MKRELVFQKNIEVVEFWRGEYAKRRMYLENKKDYKILSDMVRQFKDVAQIFLEVACHDLEPDDSRICESRILHQLENGERLEDILGGDLIYHLKKTCSIDPYPCCDFVLALSMKYGYIASDLLLETTASLAQSKRSLLHMVQTFSESYWKNYVDSLEPVEFDGYALCIEELDIKIDIARHFGPNALPWHKTTTHISKNADLLFRVSGIDNEDFQIQTTLAEIERQLSKARLIVVQQERKEIEKSEEKSTSRSKKGVRYTNLMKEEKKLITRIDSPSNQPPGPHRPSSGEQSRAYGLFLWDTVHIEGEKAGKAVDILRKYLGKAGDGLAPIPKGTSGTSYDRMRRITDRCIRENLFLPMSIG